MFSRSIIIRAVAALGLAVLLPLGLYLYGQSRYRAGVAAQQQAYALAELQAFRSESKRLTGLSVALAERIDTLARIRPAIIERYTHEIRERPLPDGCLIDADRLRHLNAALALADAARAAGQSGRNLPADTDAGK